MAVSSGTQKNMRKNMRKVRVKEQLRFLYPRRPLLFSPPNQNRHARQANSIKVKELKLIFFLQF